MSLPPDFFTKGVEQVARNLIGVTLLVDGVGGPIVETEAYDREDPASHSFRGRTPRNAVMFGPPGHAYVYRIYGLHWCLNFTTGSGSAVLIRALEPSAGMERMAERRGTAAIRRLCAGPGMLCQALAVDGRLDGVSLADEPFALHLPLRPPALAIGTRIGISRGAETAWRFGDAGSPYLSRPFTDLA